MGKDLKGKELGEGLCQIKDGRYVGRYTDRYGNRKSIYGHKLKEVKERYNKAIYMRDMYAGDLPTKQITVNELYQLWFEERVTALKPSTQNGYELTMHKYVLPVIGEQLAKSVRRETIQLLADNIRENCMAATTRDHLNKIHNMFEYGVRRYFVATNPCVGIEIRQTSAEKAQAVQKRNSHYFSGEQIRRLISYAQDCNYIHLALMKFLLSTGLRIGEGLALTWQDIDYDNNIIHVTKTFVRVSGMSTKLVSYTQPPKTQSSIRAVPLCDAAKRALDEQRNTGYTSKTFIFTKKNSQPYRTASPSSSLRKLIEHYNEDEVRLSEREKRQPQLLPTNRMHALRHTFATQCFESDISPKVVQGCMGHATITMTMDRYTHLNQNKLQDEIKKLNNMF